MLIKVFGIWLMASNINYLDPRSRILDGESCRVYMNGKDAHYEVSGSCNRLAEEINKQIKGQEQ